MELDISDGVFKDGKLNLVTPAGSKNFFLPLILHWLFRRDYKPNDDSKRVLTTRKECKIGK